MSDKIRQPIEIAKSPSIEAKFELAWFALAALVNLFSAIAIILQIQQFLSGVPGSGQGLAGGLKDRANPETALRFIAILVFTVNQSPDHKRG